jgi:hypothetical protein
MESPFARLMVVNVERVNMMPAVDAENSPHSWIARAVVAVHVATAWYLFAAPVPTVVTVVAPRESTSVTRVVSAFAGAVAPVPKPMWVPLLAKTLLVPAP